MANWGLLDGLGKGLLMVGENALKRKNLDYEMKIREAYEQGMERLRHSNNMELVGAENENRAGLLETEHKYRMAQQDDDQAARAEESGTAYERELALVGARGDEEIRALDYRVKNRIGDETQRETPEQKLARSEIAALRKSQRDVLANIVLDEDVRTAQVAEIEAQIAQIRDAAYGPSATPEAAPPSESQAKVDSLSDQQRAEWTRNMARARALYPNAAQEDLMESVLNDPRASWNADKTSTATKESAPSVSEPVSTTATAPSTAVDAATQRSARSREVEADMQRPTSFDPASVLGAANAQDAPAKGRLGGLLSGASSDLRRADARSLLRNVKARIQKGVKPKERELESFRKNMRFLSEEEQAEVRSILAWAESQ